MSQPGRLFRFVQLEIPWPLGPAEGRYLLRSAAPAPGAEPPSPGHVLVLALLGAPERRRLAGRRRPAPVEPEPGPEPVVTSRATIIDVAHPLPGAGEGEGWLATAGEPEVLAGLAELNRVLLAHRVAAADSHVHPVAREQVIAARVGVGDGDRVADGRWVAAREIPAPVHRRRRRAVLEPQARLAGLIGGRDAELVAEELVLRARSDLELGRSRHAALGLLVTLDTAIAELEADPAAAELRPRLEELRERREAVGAAAQAALTGEPDLAGQEAVAATVARIESALRARLVARD